MKTNISKGEKMKTLYWSTMSIIVGVACLVFLFYGNFDAAILMAVWEVLCEIKRIESRGEQ